MGWRDDLRRVTLADGRKLIGASFRGVPFFVQSSERAGGRRIVLHEFPLRDDPYVEDLGRHARVFSVDGYVLGDDYVSQRDDLISALEAASGPGELVHPYHGVRRAICSGLSVKESIADGGIASFSIEFTETPAQGIAPSIEVDLPGMVAASADAAVAATQAEFAAAYSPAGLPAFALASAETAIKAASNELGAALAPAVSDAQELAALNAQVHLVTSEASALVRQPANVLGAVLEVVTALENTAASAPGGLVSGLIAAYGADLGVLAPATTTTRVRERVNQLALIGALRQILAIEAGRLAVTVVYPSMDEATAARDAVAALLEEQAATAGDIAYPALVRLRSDVLRGIPGDAALARTVPISRRTTIPSLLLTYQLYGSVDEEADVIARNAVSNPCFIAGDLMVLSSG